MVLEWTILQYTPLIPAIASWKEWKWGHNRFNQKATYWLILHSSGHVHYLLGNLLACDIIL